MKRRKSRRHEQFRKVIGKLRHGGWFYPKVLQSKLKLPYRTIKHDLRLGLHLGIFKQENEKGPYAWIDYESEEEIIRKVIEDHCPYGVKAVLQSKYRPSSDLFDEICKDAGIISGKNPDDPKFKTLVYKTFSKLLDDNSCIMSKPP